MYGKRAELEEIRPTGDMDELCEVHRWISLAAPHLAAGACIARQNRGNVGQGEWKVELAPSSPRRWFAYR
jgi:hypothetical protein